MDWLFRNGSIFVRFQKPRGSDEFLNIRSRVSTGLSISVGHEAEASKRFAQSASVVFPLGVCIAITPAFRAGYFDCFFGDDSEIICSHSQFDLFNVVE